MHITCSWSVVSTEAVFIFLHLEFSSESSSKKFWPEPSVTLQTVFWSSPGLEGIKCELVLYSQDEEDLSSLVRFPLQRSSLQNWLSRTWWCPSPRRYFKQSWESAAIYTTGGCLTVWIFFQEPWRRKGNWKRREKLSSKIHRSFFHFLCKTGMVLFSLSLQKTSGAWRVNFVQIPSDLCLLGLFKNVDGACWILQK